MNEWRIPLLQIGDLRVKLIQGGMGVGISQAGLASAVANEGGAGIIASVGLGAIKGYFAEQIKINQKRLERASGEERRVIYDELYAEANRLALMAEIRIAREKTNGVIGVNIMHALSDYSSLVQGAVEANADLIISGAGIPRDLPSYLRADSKTKLVPIVSSARLAEMICKSWVKYMHLPDAIIVEGPKAGGHLGYSYEQLTDPNNPGFVEQGLETIVKEVIQVARTIEERYGQKIPVIAAGGIFYGGDIDKFLKLDAAGVQMATRFVTTDECDASRAFKEEYLKCNKPDLRIIKSPVGMPGRAITDEFLEKVTRGETIPIACPYHCLKTCIPAKSPYCIANALTSALEGKFETGYVFAGSNAYLCDEIIPVKKVFEKINQEFLEGKVSS
jgi:nitronate monooxygenase